MFKHKFSVFLSSFLFLTLLSFSPFNGVILASNTQIKLAELIQVYSSDATLFVQGLELNSEGNLILGTGQYGSSEIGHMNLDQGYLENSQALDAIYFGEGLTIKDDFVWQLTWKENTAFKRDKKTLKVVDEFTYDGEGWGLAFDWDRNVFWMSDGSDKLQMRDSDSFELLDEVEVTFMDQALFNINELEYANGLVWANVWYQEFIVAIDPETGMVVNYYDVSSILDDLELTDEEENRMDSLNGIAHIEGDRFYITGKFYPVIMEVVLPLD